jgi:hypothetical protein
MNSRFLFKSFGLPILVSFISLSLWAQSDLSDKPSRRIGISYSSFGESSLIRFQSLVGAPGYHHDQFVTLGINYFHPMLDWLDLETGVEFSQHTIYVHPNLPPMIDVAARKATLSLLSIPATLRASLFRYFFFNGGVFLNIDSSGSSPIDSQSGLGGMVGAGIQYEFNFGLGLFVNPYFKAHALLPFSHGQNHQRLMESGLRMGITFRLPG